MKQIHKLKNEQFLKNYYLKEAGFTLIEMVVVAPIVIIVIGVFIATIINITGDVLSKRSANDLSLNVQNALNYIEQDIKTSGGFLSTNNITLNSPQGYNDDTTSFHNIDANTGAMLILNSYATLKNPLDSNPNILYASGQPNPCDSTLISKNQPVMMNIVYFVKNNTLWRRTIAQSNYETVGCSKPWQQPSCAENIVDAFCKSKDLRLVDGVDAYNGFTISYFPDQTSTTANTIIGDSNQTDTTRQSALKLNNTALVSITATTTAAGKSVIQSGSIRATSPNNNFNSTPVVTIAPSIISQPQNKTVLHGENIEMSANATGTGLTVQWQLSTDHGVTWSNISNVLGIYATTLTISPATTAMDGYQYRAIFTNSAGSTTSSSAKLTVNSLAWALLSLQNGWTAYNSGFFEPSYLKTSDGVVVLRGLICTGGSPTDGQVIANLPVGYRPSATLVFAASTSPGAYTRIEINSNGDVVYRGGSASWISLDNVRFVPDTGRYNRTFINSFQNGWSSAGNPLAAVSYVVDNSERVDFQGSMNIGVLNDGTTIFTMPTKIAPPLYMHIPAAGAVYGDLGISNTVPGFAAKGRGSSWLSLQTMYYPATYNAWSNLTTQNNWVAYDNGTNYATPQYTKAADGLVTIKGLLRAGSTAADTIIATLPSGYRPSSRLVFSIDSVNSYGRIDIDNNGNILFEVGSTSWISLDNIIFYADR